MNIATPEFQRVVQSLIDDLKPSDCIDADEYKLAQEFEALPLGIGLWSYFFLRPDGEVISTELEPDEVSRSRSTRQLICSLVDAANRYPQLTAFIPDRPQEAIVCPACQGTKLSGRIVGTNKPGRCVFCAGLGWTVADT